MHDCQAVNSRFIQFHINMQAVSFCWHKTVKGVEWVFNEILSLSLFFLIIFRLKGDLAYNYKGPRTKDDIVEFANRVAG